MAANSVFASTLRDAGLRPAPQGDVAFVARTSQSPTRSRVEKRHESRSRFRQPGFLSRSRRRDRAAARGRPGGRNQLPDRRPRVDDHHAGSGRTRAQGQPRLHHTQGRRHGRRAALVDAAHGPRVRQQHAQHGRARPHAAARARRRGVSPPRGARHGAAHPRDRRGTGRRFVRAGESGRPRDALRAPAAALGHLRAARPAARRPAQVHRLGRPPASAARSASSACSRPSRR
jgi:hypothetical protein